MEKYIDFQHITKRFGGQTALDDVSFAIGQGEIHAIIGENGAGKSTLLNILHGVFPATSGTVRIGGESVYFHSISEANRFGIAKVHQEINSIPEMTVADNLLLGNEPSSVGFLNRKEMNRQAQVILDKLHCDFSATEKMYTLSTGQKQMVSIAKALYLNAKIISFDEPTASLSDAEAQVLFDIIHELRDNGITILFISHKLDEVFRMCGRATVLRDGRYIDTFSLKDTGRDEIIQAMVGRDVSMFARRTRPSRNNPDKTVLSVENLSGKGFRNVSLTLHEGEILGMFGLVGAGRTETIRAIYGANRLDEGTVKLGGESKVFRTPNRAVQHGIALISENRKEEGILPNLNNMDNIALSSLKKYRRGPFLSNRAKFDSAEEVGATVGLTPNDPLFMTSSLSGGNAQKVILARWIETDAKIMIFDEPTKGIDIGSKAEIYRLMEDMVEAGKSILMISSELTEIIGMSDRILVMHEGGIVAEIMREDFSEERILHYAMEGA